MLIIKIHNEKPIRQSSTICSMHIRFSMFSEFREQGRDKDMAIVIIGISSKSM